MPSDWKAVYEAAMRESDPALMLDRCERARRAIFDRLIAGGADAPDAVEVEELEDASRCLTLREFGVDPPPPR